MKNLIGIIFMLFHSLQTFGSAIITIKVKNAMLNTSVSIINDFYALDRLPLIESKLNNDGIGIINYNAANEKFLIIDIGFRTVRLLVKPNEEYCISYDAKNPNKIKFTGKDSSINTFIEQSNQLLLNYTYNNKTYIDWEEQNEFPDGMKELSKVLLNFLQEYSERTNLSNLDVSFLKDYLILDLLSIKMGIYQSKFDAFFSGKHNSIPIYYQNIKEEIIFKDSFLSQGFYIYQSVLSFYSNIYSSIELTKNNGTWELFKNQHPNDYMGKYINSKLEIINSLNIPKISKSFMLANVLINEVEDSDVLEPLFNNFKKSFPDSEFLTYIEKRLQKIKKSNSGIFFPKINSIDLNDKLVELSHYRGKFVYVDIWATWCGPCIKEIPSTFKLQQNFKTNQDIVFLNISLDEDKDKWKAFVSKNKFFTGIHINLSKEETSNLMEFLDMKGIPRYVLVGKDGKIIYSNAERPSSIKVEEQLKNVLLTK
jgi:thiol-disulfide isomerase/thioredoxin